jgi:hypothetical protein
MVTRYIDDYGMVRLDRVDHACLIDPCECADPDDVHGPRRYLIGFLMDGGRKAYRCTIDYPTRLLRDAAWEAIQALVKQMTGQAVEEDD